MPNAIYSCKYSNSYTYDRIEVSVAKYNQEL